MELVKNFNLSQTLDLSIFEENSTSSVLDKGRQSTLGKLSSGAETTQANYYIVQHCFI